MTKTKEIRVMSAEDLNKRLDELKKELLKDNSQIATGTSPKSPGNLKKNKKDIARILTILKEKEVTNKDE
ncbi:MAG: 50S ribosomal protein L29 [Nanoarchaeota archaeon]|nr:50S ribosomal protein L29 [Nanoarchaeota archaeon]MBU1704085.1 50S ribosomal protein L29 [Nanoarchaeota archaeon]